MPRSLRIYEAGLTAGFVALLAITTALGEFADPLLLALFATYIAVIEYSDLNFYDEQSRLGLSASEAILFPMLVALTTSDLLWAIAIAVAAREIKRLWSLKGRFNVAQYSLAAGAAAWLWSAAGDKTGALLTPMNLAVLTVAVILFSAATHVFTSIAIALSQGKPFHALVGTALWETTTNLAGSIVLGWLFTAAYLAAWWTVLFFPLVLAVFFVGYRAFLRQHRERERLEKVHDATRALAAGPDLESSLEGFLRAVQDAVSARSSALMFPEETADGLTWRSMQNGVNGGTLQPVVDGPLLEVAGNVLGWNEPVLMTQDEQGSNELLARLGISGLIATPLRDDRVRGVLIVMERIGADEFEDDDLRLLAALSDELVVTLDAYRLFAQVEEERERFARIFNGSTEGICLIDASGVVRAWNPALEKISGYEESDVLGRVWSDVVMLRDVDQQRIQGEDLVVIPPDSEVELVTKSGPTRWVSLLSGPTQANEDPGWVVLVRDVSAEHELEAAKSDFLSTISHELRTPLTTIKGSLQVLERGPDRLPPELASQMIGVTTRGAERLERLVMNLLVVSQIESGGLPVFVEEVPFDDVVLERIGIILRDHERLQVNQKHEKLTVRGDRERIGQAVEHILDNAVKFGGPEGLITIDIERRNGYAHVAVTDEGPGIATHEQEKIWERFVRLGDVLTRETQGAGVGLFITKRSIEALEGEVWVESEPGKGSTFHMTVPLAHPMVVEDHADTA